MMIELVSFQLKPGVSEPEFIQEVDVLIRDFIAKQIGYIRVDVAKDPNSNSWVAVHYWDNIENNTIAINNTRSSEIWQQSTRGIDLTTVKRQQLNILAGVGAE